jgi:hypothetical protein
MADASREKVARDFSEAIVVDAYLAQLAELTLRAG